MTAPRKTPKKTRLNLRIPVNLDVFVKQYASSKNTTVTQLVVDYFTALRDQQEKTRAA